MTPSETNAFEWDSSTPGATILSVAEDSSDAMFAAMLEWWRVLLAHAESVAEEGDVLVMDAWTETGRIIGFPQPEGLVGSERGLRVILTLTSVAEAQQAAGFSQEAYADSRDLLFALMERTRKSPELRALLRKDCAALWCENGEVSAELVLKAN